MFLDDISTGPVGFVTRTTRELLDHIYQTYRQVIPLNLNENDILMRKPYNYASPIKCIYKQNDNGQIFARQAQSPYALKQLITMGEAAIVATCI